MQEKILIVEDDKAICDLFVMALTNKGYCCDVAMRGDTALEYLGQVVYDLILLDVMLPKINGCEIMKYITPRRIPVIFLTAKIDVADRVYGLALGGDDSIVKPFDVIELLVRIEAVLHRNHGSKHLLCYHDIIMNVDARTVKKHGEEIYLTMKEFELFKLFLMNRNIVMHREQMYQTVWQQEMGMESRTLDLHIQKLRRKLDLARNIQTVYKVGYKLVE